MFRSMTALAFAATFFPATGTALSAADTYKLDPTHVAALFKIDHAGFSWTWGRFNDVGGTITWDAANPTASAVNVTIKTASVDTGTAKKDEHLRSGDFFSVREFPEMTFASKSFEAKGDNLYHVTGDFSLRGVTKSITIPVTLLKVGEFPPGTARIGFDSEFTIKRSDYGMTYGAGAVGDEVTIIFAVEGTK